MKAHDFKLIVFSPSACVLVLNFILAYVTICSYSSPVSTHYTLDDMVSITEAMSVIN